MRRWSKRIVGAGLLTGVAYSVWRVIEERRRTSPLEWSPAPFPSPPRPVVRDPGGRDVGPGDASVGTTTEPARDGADDAGTSGSPGVMGPRAWVAPDGGECPASHPVKAKLASGIFHTPGGLSYERTIPDRCYADPSAAESDGLRASKR